MHAATSATPAGVAISPNATARASVSGMATNSRLAGRATKMASARLLRYTEWKAVGASPWKLRDSRGNWADATGLAQRATGRLKKL
jgi:hypothetical protein